MDWINRKYHFYLIFADTIENKEPWKNDIWTNKLQPIFDSLIKHSEFYNKTGLSSLQYKPRPDSQYYDEMKFGKLRWNDKSHGKWTLHETDSSRIFKNIISWTPMRTVCIKNELCPDIYINISSEKIML